MNNFFFLNIELKHFCDNLLNILIKNYISRHCKINNIREKMRTSKQEFPHQFFVDSGS